MIIIDKFKYNTNANRNYFFYMLISRGKVKLLVSTFVINLLLSSAGFAQAVNIRAITEPGRRGPRQVEEVIEQAQPKIIKEKAKSTKLPIAPPGAEEQEIDGFKGMIIEGGSVYSDESLSGFYTEFVDKTINLAQIFQIARDIQNKYRNEGYLLTRVLVPEQEPTKGIIKLKIVEGYIESVRIEGDAAEYQQRIKKYLNKLTGMVPVNNHEIERYLLLINDLPGVSARAVVRPEKNKLGATELVVRVEVKRFDGLVLVNNRGSKFRGPFRILLEGTSNSLLNLEEELKLVFLTTFEDNEQHYGSISYKQPLGTEGVSIRLSASYGPSEPGDSLERFDIESESYYFSGDINYPLIRSRNTNLNLEFGCEMINSDTDVFGESSVRDRLRVMHATAQFDVIDTGNAQSQISFSVRQGINALGASPEKGNKLSRFEGKSDFTLLQTSMSRLQPIISNTSILIAAKGQYAFDTLLSDEEFFLGGEQFGRAYDISALTGEHGVAATTEIQQNLTTPFQVIPNYQVYGFYDFGVVWNKDLGVESRQSLASAGAGFRAMIFDNFSIGFEVAKPLTRVVAAEQNNDPRFFFHISGRY